MFIWLATIFCHRRYRHNRPCPVINESWHSSTSPLLHYPASSWNDPTANDSNIPGRNEAKTKNKTLHRVPTNRVRCCSARQKHTFRPRGRAQPSNSIFSDLHETLPLSLRDTAPHVSCSDSSDLVIRCRSPAGGANERVVCPAYAADCGRAGLLERHLSLRRLPRSSRFTFPAEQ